MCIRDRPGTSFDEETHIVTLKEGTRKDNARFFENDINKVPTHAITMGIATIMKEMCIRDRCSDGSCQGRRALYDFN